MYDERLVGIDHIAVYIPGQALSMEALAEARGIPPKKYLVGLDLLKIAIPGRCDDVVSMAANAGYTVLEQAGVEPSEIGFLAVGTESSVDKSKPVATHVHRMLGISERCRVFDVIHACIGATQAVLSALDWLKLGHGKYALVIASDIARYKLNTLAEPTQGAGAVALLLAVSPRLMTLTEVSAYSRHVYDFWKPLHEEFPIVNGHYSSQCYLDAMKECYAETVPSSRSALLFHTPYPKLVYQAYSQLAVIKAFSENVDATFKKQTEPSLAYSRRVGNIYTGSLWLSLASMLGSDNAHGSPAGRWSDCWLYSYGSGMGASLMHGVFGELPHELLSYLNLWEFLKARDMIDVPTYEGLHNGSLYGRPAISAVFGYDSLRDGKRVYKHLSSGKEYCD